MTPPSPPPPPPPPPPPQDTTNNKPQVNDTQQSLEDALLINNPYTCLQQARIFELFANWQRSTSKTSATVAALVHPRQQQQQQQNSSDDDEGEDEILDAGYTLVHHIQNNNSCDGDEEEDEILDAVYAPVHRIDSNNNNNCGNNNGNGEELKEGVTAEPDGQAPGLLLFSAFTPTFGPHRPTPTKRPRERETGEISDSTSTSAHKRARHSSAPTSPASLSAAAAAILKDANDIRTRKGSSSRQSYSNNNNGINNGRGRGSGGQRGNTAKADKKNVCITKAIEKNDANGDMVAHRGGLTDSTVAHAQHQQQQYPKTAKLPSGVPALDTNSLPTLPEDTRAEIEAAHQVEMIKNQRKQEAELTAQSDATTASRQRYLCSGANDLQTCVGGGSVLERPTLMGKREIGDLRVLLTQWVQSSLVDQNLHQATRKNDSQGEKEGGVRDTGGAVKTVVYDEGPSPEDVQSFVDFVSRVIVMERDLERVRLLLRYLRRRIEDNDRQVEPVEMKPPLKETNLLSRVSMSWRQALDWILHVARHLVFQIYDGSFDIN
ncbi:hypothetical protein BGX24_000981 [Mortierella sp. AD032]|nr:hypothetical protein BGX24_000981 [Mortierella sp. AD032]